MEGKIINSSEYVYYKEGDSIMTGGMKIDNMYLNENIPAMVRMGGEHKNLMVPMGLIQLNTQYGGNKHKNVNSYYPDTSNKGVVSDSLYDKLLDMASDNMEKIVKGGRKNRKTNKKNKSSNKKRKTRKKKRMK